MKPLISIQILNWNRAEETQRAIASAYAQTYPNIEVVVVDNGSTDNSVELTRSSFPKAKVVELNKNYGCPGGRNRGIAHCKGDYIFYLDNDGVLHKDAVSNAYNSMISAEDVKVVTGKVLPFDNEDEINSHFLISEALVYEHSPFQGGISMHDKSIYAHVGQYPDHFMYGAEELYMSLKILDNNFRILKDESVILWHRRSLNERNRPKEIVSSFFNRLYTAIVLFPFWHMLSFIVYFLLVYPYYAFRQKVLKEFISVFFKQFFIVLKNGLSHRSPISLSAYHLFQRFKKLVRDNVHD